MERFMPHGFCMRWDYWLLFTHVTSDAWIALAYFSIPIALVVFVRKRKDIQFGAIFWLFSLFIFFCGMTHVASIFTLWYPNYWMEGWLKAATAIVSVLTAVVLWPVIPKALKIPSFSQLHEANEKLEVANQALRGATEAKNRFLASMSHELRTPLNGVIGFAEVLVDGKTGPLNPKQQEYMEDILDSGRHLLQLINDILDLAKVEAGRMEFYAESFSLQKALAEVCAVTEPLVRKKNIQFVTSVAPEIGDVLLDQQKLKQVLYNLISNALKFTPERGRVEVVMLPNGANDFILAVKDNGIGIRPEDFKRLFTEFEQLEPGTSQYHQGTGLGLALTRKIVELQGGTIAVDSRVNEGSTFTVILPRVIREAQA